MDRDEYKQKVGKRVKEFREKFYEGRKITQLELLEVFGSKSTEDKKANLIYMIEHGTRSLTEENIRKLADHYGVQPGYFRLETEFMREEVELVAGNNAAMEAQQLRRNYYKMLLALHGFSIRYKDGCCIIRDKAGDPVSFERDEMLSLIQDFEDHFAFQVQQTINREKEKRMIEESDQTLLSRGSQA